MFVCQWERSQEDVLKGSIVRGVVILSCGRVNINAIDDDVIVWLSY